MKTIQLTQNKVALVDDEDFSRLNAFKWHARRGTSGVWYAKRSVNNSTRYMHQEVLDARSVDHVNGDGLDNRKENLRAATRSQQQANSRVRRNKTHSSYKGVCRTFNGGKWVWKTQIVVNGKRFQRYSDSEAEAARKYNELAAQHFGEFAHLNVLP